MLSITYCRVQPVVGNNAAMGTPFRQRCPLLHVVSTGKSPEVGIGFNILVTTYCAHLLSTSQAKLLSLWQCKRGVALCSLDRLAV